MVLRNYNQGIYPVILFFHYYLHIYFFIYNICFSTIHKVKFRKWRKKSRKKKKIILKLHFFILVKRKKFVDTLFYFKYEKYKLWFLNFSMKYLHIWRTFLVSLKLWYKIIDNYILFHYAERNIKSLSALVKAYLHL